MNLHNLGLVPLWYSAFLLSIVCHEAAHALAAKVGGDDTAEDQITIHPMPHIRREPVGTVLVPLASLFWMGFPIGWASAPYNHYWAVRYPRRASLMALAGPAANFLLVILAAICMHIGLATHFFTYPDYFSFTSIIAGTGPWSAAMAIFLSIMLSLNLLLGVFNLIPLPPLDGISIIGLILPVRYALKLQDAAKNPQFAMVGMIAAWFIVPVIFSPAFVIGLKILFLY